MGQAKPNDIVFDDLAEPKLTFLQKLALKGAKKGVVEFTQEAVLSAAREVTGLSDFGNESFREALQVLLDDYANDEGLSGKAAFRIRPTKVWHHAFGQFIGRRLPVSISSALGRAGAFSCAGSRKGERETQIRRKNSDTFSEKRG